MLLKFINKSIYFCILIFTSCSEDSSKNSNNNSLGHASIKAIAKGSVSSHVCALTNNGNVYCWGDNTQGQLGINSFVDQLTPVQVMGVGGIGYLSDIVSIAVGGSHTCAVSNSGSLFCWGYNTYGQLGNNSLANQKTPVQVMGVGAVGFLSGISSVSAGLGQTCATTGAGLNYCWGQNSSGQLGINNTTQQKTPVQVLGVGGVGNLNGIIATASGYSHTCAISSIGNMYCWGSNTNGQLGINNTTQQNTPVQVLGVGAVGNLAGISQISLGSAHSCALISGSIYCWGLNAFGQLGINNTIQKLTPVQVLGIGGVGLLSNIIQFSSGHSHICAVTDLNSVSCWGDGGSGNIGVNSLTQQNTPVDVLGISGVGFLNGISTLMGGSSLSCANSTIGYVYCWGWNSRGQIGNNTLSNQLTAVQVLHH